MSRAVTISYKDLVEEKDLTTETKTAFGSNGLGLILVKGVPNLKEKRLKILNLTRQFANLPEKIKEKYTHPESHYSYGWSHGKEKMKGGIPDIAKGSYYANPVADCVTDDEELKKKFPGTYSDNIWPKEDLPELEIAFKNMSKLQLDLGFRMCHLFDRYLNKVSEGQHEIGTIYKMISDSNTYKGRLLHYFPMEDKSSNDIDSFCGWHLDHGGVTTLLSPLYLDLDGNPVEKPDNCGLYIKALDGSTVKVDIPEDCFAVQLGEMLQYFSGGLLRATPHCVRACPSSDTTREQFAMFMDCVPEQPLKLPKYSLDYSEVVHTPYLPKGVPALKDRIKDTHNYREFVVNTIKAYYESKEPTVGGGS